MGLYTTFKDKRGQFRFNLKAANHEIILQSEGYNSPFMRDNGIAAIRLNCTIDSRYERRIASNGKSYFVLKAANGEIIGRSELYGSRRSLENGIASVKKNGLTRMLRDE